MLSASEDESLQVFCPCTVQKVALSSREGAALPVLKMGSQVAVRW